MYSFIPMCVHAQMRLQANARHSVHVEVRGQLAGLAFYILSCGDRDSLLLLKPPLLPPLTSGPGQLTSR